MLKALFSGVVPSSMSGETIGCWLARIFESRVASVEKDVADADGVTETEVCGDDGDGGLVDCAVDVRGSAAIDDCSFNRIRAVGIM